MLKLPPPVWALVYVLFVVAISWWLEWPKMPGFPLPQLGFILATVPWILALLIWCRNTDGPYRFTRNPMYLGLVIVTLGIAVWVGAWPMFLAPIAIFATTNWVHIPYEEAKMRRQFGATYDGYIGRVRRWV